MTASIPPSGTAQVIPVMDLMGGVVVCGRGGKREEYTPISSSFLASPDPFHFVERIYELFGFTIFYVADLDAIMGKGNGAGIIKSLATQTPFEFIVDGGYANIHDAPLINRLTPVFSTESFTGWKGSGDLSNAVVSLDFAGGRLLSSIEGLTPESALALAREKGCRRFIHLRVDAVGGKSFDSRFTLPTRRGEDWMYGGGIRSAHDLRALARLGYGSALVSTALLDGTLQSDFACEISQKRSDC